VRPLLLSGLVSFVLAIFSTPLAIRFLSAHGIGQEIRDDGPTSHHSKRGTPTMGGLVIIGSTVLGYTVSHLPLFGTRASRPTPSALLALGIFVALGAIGFADDFIKVRKQRSLGLNMTAKLVAQFAVALTFGVLALTLRDSAGNPLASRHLSFIRDLTWLSLGSVGFVILAYLIITAASNAVNLTDGLDGLATGTSVMVLLAYALIAFWQFRHNCDTRLLPKCYVVSDPLDLSFVAFAAAAACFGFLWWNAAPARIFMGDTGSLALGGLLAALAILTRTELLLLFLGGLFVLIALSVIIQVAFFRLTGRRVFRMAPLQHHFELAGWGEVTIVIRFWIIAGVSLGVGLGLFYADYLIRV